MSKLQPLQVVVLDPYADQASTMADMLGIHGFEARGTTSPVEALEWVRQHRPMVAVTELDLGDESILEFATEARALVPRLGLIAVTSRQAPYAREIISTFEKVMLKPAVPLQVVDAVRACVEARRALADMAKTPRHTQAG